ncbi:hypothetical protein N7462_002475 [Penicillium macrosclerotiorum]|uniref:uncharacterized protein n=1 Tax=Penicillium macrosclerotiorum TaxID=303699 RepID=UPI0025473E4C|nr:uncharacterized protein N7462_002475 [Penicillium macrosclerotiorum]KAJ5693052.1 hypothetical protein N7462_002475 [Penicillium macrosclerotiorum]
MVLLVATDRILTALNAVPASSRQDLELPTELELHGPIAHEQLLRLSKHLQDTNYTPDSTNHASTILNTLLRGTKVYVPPPLKKPEPSPEYLASKARLLAAAEKQAYQRLLNPAYTPTPDHADPHSTLAATDSISAEDTLTPSLVVNIFLSVLITGFSVYWALTKFTMPAILAVRFAAWTGPRGDAAPSGGASDAVRVLVSLFAALTVAVAESFLYFAYLGKVERARGKERRVKERKEFVGVVEGVDTWEEVRVDEREEIKEEIWGKGVNGGVRRRVREKWEKENEEKEKEKEKEKEDEKGGKSKSL